MEITRKILLAFLDKFRKSEAVDPLHKWIGTYNTYRMHLMRFFKWLYYPDTGPIKDQSQKLFRIFLNPKEKNNQYTSLMTYGLQKKIFYLKYCPSKRMKCYHAIARDLACRPHEILQLKIKDIAFKVIEDKQYAEVVVNGKTGTRSLPLIDSIPYLKDYLDHEHSQPGNPSAILISGIGKSLGRAIGILALAHIYRHYKKDLFPKLLDSPNVPPEDVKKPWNPYLNGRHTSRKNLRRLKQVFLPPIVAVTKQVMLATEKKQTIILVIQIMTTNRLMMLLQVNLLQRNLAMTTRTTPMRVLQMTMETARKLKMEKVTLKNKQQVLLPWQQNNLK